MSVALDLVYVPITPDQIAKLAAGEHVIIETASAGTHSRVSTVIGLCPAGGKLGTEPLHIREHRCDQPTEGKRT